MRARRGIMISRVGSTIEQWQEAGAVEFFYKTGALVLVVLYDSANIRLPVPNGLNLVFF